MMLMPTGMSAAEKPWSDRPTTSSAKLPALNAATKDPTVISTMQMTIISRLP